VERGDVVRLLRKKLPADEMTRRFGVLALVRPMPGWSNAGADLETRVSDGSLSAADLDEMMRFSEPSDLPDDLPMLERLRLAPSRFAVQGLVRAARSNRSGSGIQVGRAMGNDIILNHGSVSKAHACVHAGLHGDLRLRDLRSRNGTFLGDSRVGPDEPGMVLGAGDVVRFGAVACDVVSIEALGPLWWPRA
jgi:hypothetical protein